MPPLAGERWWRQPPKGVRFLARQGGCMVFPRAKPGCEGFYTNWRLLSIHRRPTTTLAPKGETTHYGLCVALLLQIMFAVHARGAMSLILDIHGDPWYHISNFKEGNDKKSRASRMAKRATCGESSAGGPPEDGLGASGPNGQARRDCPLQQQGIYGIVRRTCQVLFR